MCFLCGKVLKSKASLELHIKRHDEKRAFPCPQCPVSFVCINQLERHLMSHKPTRDYKCNQCTKTFKDPEVHKRHLKRHAGLIARKFVCTFAGCDKRFHQKFTLDNHILTHTREKPHKCMYCEAAYAQKYDLTKHLKVHVGDRIYSCTFEGCDEAFRLQVELKEHYAIHYLK
jgi:KRAB domain-containing zinc finger protein